MLVLPIVVVGIVLCVWGLLRLALPAGEQRRMPTVLSTEGRGRVSVVIQGEGTPQRAESGLKLYEGDRVQTESSAFARLVFFDGTVALLDGNSSLLLTEVLEGTEKSSLSLTVESGLLSMRTGTSATVLREVKTAFASHAVPPRTNVILGSDELAAEKTERVTVFDTSGPGIESRLRLGRLRAQEVITGEGQELVVSTSRLSSLKEDAIDPYDLRGVLDDRIFSSELYLVASAEPVPVPDTSSPEAEAEERTVEGELLVIDAPADGAMLEESTVLVKGRIGSRVTLVRVNGYAAELSDGAFTKEIALPEEEEFSVEVQAEGRDGLLIASKSVSLTRDIKPPDPPVITAPVELAIDDESFEITGTSSPDAIGIVVNGYQLQKYRPGGDWSYHVDPKIGNVKIGENSYEVYALDRSGNRSESVVINILWRAQPVPVTPVGGEQPSRDTGEYLAPGSMRVIAPTSDGSAYVTPASEVLIEGETHPDTHSVSVNGYALSLYIPGKTTWNYIAKGEFRNFVPGVNRYVIVARNSAGKILDVVRYVIEKK